MTDPTPTRAEVAVCYACGALPCDQAHTPKPHIQHTDDINDMVLLGMARDELFAENQALRERAEAAEAERDEARAAYLAHKRLRIDAEQQAHAAGRAEAAAWNDAIEAVEALEPLGRRWISRARIRALRRAAPTEGEA